MTRRVEDAASLYLPETEHDACGLGFVAHIGGQKSRAIVEDALEILRRLAHRAAAGRDPETGDGSGILLQLPHRFFKREGLARGWDMPRRRRYGVGMVFLPEDDSARAACERVIEEVIQPVDFPGDERDLMELLGNVLDNACKYGESRIRLQVEQSPTGISFVVEDNGPGIDAAYHTQVLERGSGEAVAPG